MFAQCPSLHDLSGIGGWDVSGVKDFSSMFADCYSLESLDAISRWKVSKKASMDDIFKGCARLSDAACLNSWDLGNINVHSLFDECPLLRTLPHWVYRPKPARRFNPFEGLFRRAQKRESKARFATIDYAVSLKTGKITFTSDIVFDPEGDSEFINGILLEDDNLLIDGDGHTIDARGMARVFEVTGKNITIRNFIFLNCRAGEGGAIINRGTLRLENVKFSVCRADFGGAICNASGEITIKDVEFSANMAEYGGGAIHNDGGDILIWDCLIHQNRAQHGAISNSGGRIRLRNTCIRRNRASCKGSAIANDGGVMSISACTLRENASEGLGVVVNSNGEVRIEESDIKCNSAKDYMIHNAGNLEINNCLLRLNRSKGIMFNEGDGQAAQEEEQIFAEKDLPARISPAQSQRVSVGTVVHPQEQGCPYRSRQGKETAHIQHHGKGGPRVQISSLPQDGSGHFRSRPAHEQSQGRQEQKQPPGGTEHSQLPADTVFHVRVPFTADPAFGTAE